MEGSRDHAGRMERWLIVKGNTWADIPGSAELGLGTL